MPILRLLLAMMLFTGPAVAQQTAFTYQGKLFQSGQPADGLFDIEFALFDTATGGSPLNLETLLEDVQVRQGAFSVTLDFGSTILVESELYLQIRVRPDGIGSLTLLEPRQQIQGSPRSISTEFTQPDSVDSLSIVNGSVSSGDIAANAIGSGHIGSGAVGASEIMPGAVGADEIATNSITSEKIRQGTLRFEDTDPNSIQRRVSGGCAVGSTIRNILPDGSVTCEPDRGLSSIPVVSSFAAGVSNGGISEAPMESRTSHLLTVA